jgi:hypothetical protein
MPTRQWSVATTQAIVRSGSSESQPWFSPNSGGNDPSPKAEQGREVMLKYMRRREIRLVPGGGVYFSVDHFYHCYGDFLARSITYVAAFAPA